ncbi:hypothetical protein AHAS_Ahas03G0229100 [Arachis hypogaea]
MGYYPPPQYDSIHYPNGGWEYHQELTDFEQPNQWGYTSENDQGSFPPSLEPTVEDSLQKSRKLLERQEQLLEEQKQFWTEQEFLFKKIEGHLEQRRAHSGLPNGMDEEQTVSEEEEEETPVSSETSKENEVMEVYEPRIPYPQRLIEVVEDHEDSLLKNLMEDHTKEREKLHQEKPQSSEAESCIEEGLIEPQIQEAFDEENTPTNTQPPSLDI